MNLKKFFVNNGFSFIFSLTACGNSTEKSKINLLIKMNYQQYLNKYFHLVKLMKISVKRN